MVRVRSSPFNTVLDISTIIRPTIPVSRAKALKTITDVTVF
jgi:hypothetical protein